METGGKKTKKQNKDRNKTRDLGSCTCQTSRPVGFSESAEQFVEFEEREKKTTPSAAESKLREASP